MNAITERGDIRPKSAQKHQGPVVRAIDVGFGQVKFSCAGGGSSGVGFRRFPSMAIPSNASAVKSLGSRRRDTWDVPVNAAMYEVGHEVALAHAGGSFGRDVTDEFYRSPIYAALVKGALRYMREAGDAVVDVLVLGLPVNQYNDNARRDYLRTTFSGVLDLGDEQQIVVKRVLVQAQPVGGYVTIEDHLETLNRVILATPGAQSLIESGDELEALSVLMVDPGEYTLDWLLVQEGAINQRASGAASDAGRHRVVRAVQEALERDVGRPLGPAVLARINDALRAGRPVKLAGTEHDLSRYVPIMLSVIEDSLNRMIDGLRDAHEIIDLIVLVGGHPDHYRDVLARRFPAIPVFVLPEAIFANVRGFQLIGETEVVHESAV